MILIISGTNRHGSNTLKIAKQLENILKEKKIDTKLLSLETITQLQRNEDFEKIETEFLKPATKYLIISPEYNGSFPGILKLLFDLSDVKSVWHGKKAALVGVASGRAGNLRGMDHLSAILNHIQVKVLPLQIPISSVHNIITEKDLIIDKLLLESLNKQIEELINF